VNDPKYKVVDASSLKMEDLTTFDGVCWRPKRLTYSGHKFLDAARSDTVWHKAKAVTLKSTGTLTLEGLKIGNSSGG
jgi:hypothetical protein